MGGFFIFDLLFFLCYKKNFNKTLLNIEPQPLNKNTCRDRLRNYVNNNGNLDFFKTEYFQNEKNQKVVEEQYNKSISTKRYSKFQKFLDKYGENEGNSKNKTRSTDKKSKKTRTDKLYDGQQSLFE